MGLQNSGIAMKLPSPLIVTVLAATSLCHALTENDITAAALVGKTVSFQATDGTGLLPATGTWTAKFVNNSSRDLIITNGGGIVSDYSSAYTAVTAGKPTILNIGSVYENSGQTTLTLSLSGTLGIYTMSCVFVDTSGGIPTIVTATQGGTFTLDSAGTTAPEIEVKEGIKNLVDGTAKSVFGTIQVGKTSTPKTYKITNKGHAALKNLKVTASGANKGDFQISKPGSTSLAPGKSTTFKITFAPSGKNIRSAAIKIASNDADENPFDIKLSGTGRK